MKKIIYVVLLALLTCLLTGCMKKDIITSEVFNKVLEKNNFIVTDDTESYEMQTSFKKVLNATKENDIYQVDFYEFDTIETAMQIYENQKMTIEGSSTAKSHTMVEGINYDKYEQTSDINYGVVIRVDNILIYSLVRIEHKEEIKTILKEFNY